MAPAGPFVVGSTYRFFVEAIMRSAEVWDLSNASVTLYLRAAELGGLVTAHGMTIFDATAGDAYYDVLMGDFHTAGEWTASVHVSDGAVVQETKPLLFVVVDSP
jgi:hypothetical protein